MKTTPSNITELLPDQIFVFGSNEAGRHGKGAAKTALKWGAVYGISEGLKGQTYALPTVNASISNSLKISKIKVYADRFIMCVKENPNLEFLLTEVGCGLAGKSVKEIAPLFIAAKDLSNISFPRKFQRFLK